MNLQVSLDSLVKMDEGRLAVAFQKCVAQVLDDLEDRPGDKRARSVSLVVQFRPECTEHGRFEQADMTIDFQTKIPPRKSVPYVVKPPSGGLLYNDEAPENPDQQTIDDIPGAMKPRKVN